LPGSSAFDVMLDLLARGAAAMTFLTPPRRETQVRRKLARRVAGERRGPHDYQRPRRRDVGPKGAGAGPALGESALRLVRVGQWLRYSAISVGIIPRGPTGNSPADSPSLSAIARFAEKLNIALRIAAALGDGDDVIEFQVLATTAFHAPAEVAAPDRYLNRLGNAAPPLDGECLEGVSFCSKDLLCIHPDIAPAYAL